MSSCGSRFAFPSGFPSDQALRPWPRPSENSSRKANLDPHELMLEVYTIPIPKFGLTQLLVFTPPLHKETET